jgi:hypothetical protein
MEADIYPLPNMLDFSDRLSGCSVFSKTDLRKGYWQIPVRLEDRKKTEVITPFGLFEFTRMPFGLRNAGRTGCWLASHSPTVTWMTSGLPALTLRHSSFISAWCFDRLRQFGLVINLEKCVFVVASFEFLGHVVSAQGARPITSYVEAVKRRPHPTHDYKGAAGLLGLSELLQEVLTWCGH